MTESSTQAVREWREKNPEKAKEHIKRANDAFKERMRNDPVYAEKQREKGRKRYKKRVEAEKANPALREARLAKSRQRYADNKKLIELGRQVSQE